MKKLNRIKGALADAGKTGVWLAVSKWCTNTSQPDLSTLSKIADALEIDVRELLVSNVKNPNTTR